MRNINKAGLQLIKSFEGLRLRSYLCPAKVWTIGYGSTGPHVKPGMVITEQEAESLLRDDLERFERGVAASVTVPLTDNQFASLVSLSFNIGTGAFAKSTLVKRLNAGDLPGAAEQFERWNKAGGKVLSGLDRRRKAERALFITDADPEPNPAVIKQPGLFSRLFGKR